MPTLEWIGKDKVINHHQQVPYRVLEEKYTYNAEKSDNMIIRGDNLEALKALLPKFEGKVDCIYIDPPYNTGNEKWVYNDNVNDPKIKKWLGEVVGQEGEDLSRHDKWLCMMYPRLKLLQKLLSENGSIFISIDDHELYLLKLLMDDLFGANNFIGTIIVKSNPRGSMSDAELAKVHEYLLIYSKSRLSLSFNGQSLSDDMKKEYNMTDEKGNYRLLGLRMRGGFWRRTDRPNLYYPLYVNPKNMKISITKDDASFIEVFPVQPSTGEDGTWRWSKERVVALLDLLIAKEVKRGDSVVFDVFQKDYYDRDSGRKTKTKSIWDDKELNYQNGTNDINIILGNSKIFNYSKPKYLISQIIETSTQNKEAIILDSFAGSGTTAHAVLNLNKSDGGNRKFILVEMLDYAETITAERVKRVIDGYGEGKNVVEGTGGDFTFYDLGQPLLLPDGNLNEEVDTAKIREYVWYMETKTPLTETAGDNAYYLGVNNNTGYYFFYEKDRITTLGYEFLATIKDKAESYLIYADLCTIPDDELKRHNITFKKIPRDIAKL